MYNFIKSHLHSHSKTPDVSHTGMFIVSHFIIILLVKMMGGYAYMYKVNVKGDGPKNDDRSQPYPC